MNFEFTVYLKIKSGMEDAFLSASRANQAEARKEPGNRRFDIFRSKENPSHFLFAEAYDTEDSAVLHREMPHFLKWLEAATPMMVEPRQRVAGNDVPVEYESL